MISGDINIIMNRNSSKRYQVVSSENNLDKTDVKRRKLKEVHQNSSSYANKKYDVQLFKKNAAKSFQSETSLNLNGFDELG